MVRKNIELPNLHKTTVFDRTFFAKHSIINVRQGPKYTSNKINFFTATYAQR